MKSGWRTDPNGNRYRIDFSTRTVEYKSVKVPKGVDLIDYTVEVRGELFHVSAPNPEAAANIFVSNTLPYYPKRHEVIVKEVTNGTRTGMATSESTTQRKGGTLR